jgi:hypothetical protein
MSFPTAVDCLLLLGAPVLGAPRAARYDVVRGRSDPADALDAATRDAWENAESARPVAVVLDARPHARSAAARLRAAIEALGDPILHLSGSWRIGALGGRRARPGASSGGGPASGR